MSRHLMAVAAHLVLRDARGRVLFARRAGTGYGDGCWSLPAGHVEPGERFDESCIREAREEIGVTLNAGDLDLACVQQKLDTDGQERIDVFFFAPLPAGTEPAILEPDKCDALEWAPLVSPPAPTVSYVAAALAMVAAGGGPLAYFGYGARGLT